MTKKSMGSRKKVREKLKLFVLSCLTCFWPMKFLFCLIPLHPPTSQNWPKKKGCERHYPLHLELNESSVAIEICTKLLFLHFIKALRWPSKAFGNRVHNGSNKNKLLGLKNFASFKVLVNTKCEATAVEFVTSVLFIGFRHRLA